jgi:cell division protein FtsI (penicillin-binding protein 3)
MCCLLATEMVINGRYNKNGAKRTFFTGFVPVKKPKYIMAVRLEMISPYQVLKRLSDSCLTQDISLVCKNYNFEHLNIGLFW